MCFSCFFTKGVPQGCLLRPIVFKQLQPKLKLRYTFRLEQCLINMDHLTQKCGGNIWFLAPQSHSKASKEPSTQEMYLFSWLWYLEVVIHHKLFTFCQKATTNFNFNRIFYGKPTQSSTQLWYLQNGKRGTLYSKIAVFLFIYSDPFNLKTK